MLTLMIAATVIGFIALGIIFLRDRGNGSGGTSDSDSTGGTSATGGSSRKRPEIF